MGSELKQLLNLRLVSLRDDLEALMESFYDMDELEDILDDNQRLNNGEEITAWESEENVMLENQKRRTISVRVKKNSKKPLCCLRPHK